MDEDRFMRELSFWLHPAQGRVTSGAPFSVKDIEELERRWNKHMKKDDHDFWRYPVLGGKE